MNLLYLYLKLIRFDKPIGSVLLFWPCAWGLKAGFDKVAGENIHQLTGPLCLFALGALVMRSLGCVLNDMADRDLDTKVVRTQNRPLACGALSLMHAGVIVVVLSLLGLWVFLQLPVVSRLCALIGGILMVVYPFAKRFTTHPQVILGFAFSSGVLVGYTYFMQAIDMASLALMGFSICWVVAFDTIYAFQDVMSDAQCKVGSTALQYQNIPKIAVGAWYGVGLVCLGGDEYFSHQSILSLRILIYALFSLWVLIRWRPLDNQSCDHCFKLHGYGGILGLL